MPMPPTPTAGDTTWFTHDRFGLFIHWGLYALPARHEWVQSVERLDDAHYQRYFDHFQPDLYDPHEWARTARAAGMKYVVLTAKHHEGFCLWDSAFTDYKVTNTPWGRDLLQPFVEAFRTEGLRVGLYYSLIDWHHRSFPLDVFHPQRDVADAHVIHSQRDVAVYAEYMRNQVQELLTKYGPISILGRIFRIRQWPTTGCPARAASTGRANSFTALFATLRRISL